MRHLAITGGRGRLAPLVARFFEDAGCEVHRFSRRADGDFQALERLGDPAVFSTYDAVIHAAWSTVPFTAEQNPGAAEVHDLPLLHTLLRAGSGGHTRLVFLSTGAVYGDTGETPATESTMPAPLGNYARAKLAAERLVEEGPVPAAILRISNLLGERSDPARPQGILPRLIHAARHGETVTLWGDGRATKDYLHCQDFLAALRLIVEGRRTGLWNVAAGESVSLMDLISLVEEQTGRRILLTHEPHFPWDVSFSRLSNQKLRTVTGWSPRLSLRQAVADCLAHTS